MVIRWNHLATLVVVVVASFAVVHGEQPSYTNVKVDTTNNRFEDLCPCLPVDICPRAFGANPDDAKYLGNIMKCEDDKTVRCCGASATFVIGKTTPIPATESDILTKTTAANVEENEIPDIESESVKTLSARDETTDALSLEETGNIGNFYVKEHLDGGTDEEAAESESVIKTANDETNEDGQSKREPFETAPKSHRQPKNLDGVVAVYPNIMSGIPKTTPKNLPHTNEMKVFDEEIGMDLHLIFSETTLQPEPTEEVTPSSTVLPTSKQPLYRFPKRRRQFRPASTTDRVSTTETSVNDLEPKQATVRSHPRQRVNLRKSVSRPSSQEPTHSTTRRPRVTLATTESSANDLESKQTTIRSHPRQRFNLRNSISRPSSQESTNSTTRRPRVTLATTPSDPSTTQDKEILVTSEDDKSQSSRFRLFNARRLNYLRRNTTATSTTEYPIEPTTRPTIQSKPSKKKRPSNVREKSSEIRGTSRNSKMDENLIRVVDGNHQNMISMVRVALKAATSGNIAVEIPRSFASADIGDRVKKIEGILVEQMVNVYAETLAKLRSDQTEINVKDSETATAKPTTSSTRPFRGNKKFVMSDLLDKTPVVTMSPDEFRRTMRLRRPIVRTEQQVAVNIVPTTRRPHRRLTIEYMEALNTNTRDTSSSENNEEGSVRRRVKTRRRYKVEPSSTFSTPIQGNPQTELTYSTISPTIPTTISIETTSPTPEATMLTDEIESTSVLNEPKAIDQEELTERIENDTEDDTREEPLDVTQDETKQTVMDVSIQNVDIDEVSSKNPSSNSNVLSDFKPSPLWSISSDEKDDFIIKEENHSYLMNMDERERAFRKKNRHSRNAFDPPVLYLNGFVPASPLKITGPIPKSSKLGDEAIVRYNLPRETKANFSKN